MLLSAVTEICWSFHEDLQPAEHDAPHSPLVGLPAVPGADDAGFPSRLLGGHRGAAGLCCCQRGRHCITGCF